MNKTKTTIVKLFSTAVLGISSLLMNPMFSAKSVQAETVLGDINRTGVLKVGIRGDVIPFGYRDLEGNLAGICFDLVELIEAEVLRQTDRNYLSTKLLLSSLYNRFDIVEDNFVHLECGPNTIRELEDYDVTFSEPFFVTGVRFISHDEVSKKLVNSEGKDLRIGLLRYTSTEGLITQRYPEAEFQYFQGQKGALRAFQALSRQEIDAFASDSILLIGESVAEKFPLGETTGYILTPEKSLRCEKYGFVLPVDNPDWKNLVDKVLASDETKEVFRKWFSAFPSDSFRNLARCSIDQ